MALQQNIYAKDVWRRVGKKVFTVRLRDSLRPANLSGSEHGLLLHWPKSWDFLNVTAEHGDKKAFSKGRQALEAVALEMRTKAPDQSYLEGRQVLVARVQQSDPYQIRFELDTDDPTFEEFASALQGKGQNELRVAIDVMAFAGGIIEQGEIKLVLTPAAEVPMYEGYVALDVGNTASTLVCLPHGIGRLQTSAIRVLDANEERLGSLKENPDPVVSDIRLESEDKNRSEQSPLSVKAIVGRMASARTDGLVVGPKRLAAGGNWEEKQVFNSQTNVVLPRRIPAELLVCKLFQRFREATYRHPESLALTYPTTYEPRELKQLREIVYRGYQRSRWCGQDNAKDEERVRKRVPVILDEASAAAFFFLYQRVLETPGGLPRFRFLYPYPSGMNLLLYDCGGGTTDIALVNASSEPGSNKLIISVKARTGVRGFGGDNITEAVFRILKGKLAFECARLQGKKELASQPFPDKPVTSQVLNEFLEKNSRRYDEFVPTQFDHDSTDDVSRKSRNFALNLWQWAEALKCKLGTYASLEKGMVEAGQGQHSLWEFLLSKFSADPVRVKQAMTALLVKIHRWEVDCLVADQISQTIKNCNKLIHTKLTADGQEVHWVVASGNGARYPLIQELLKKDLAVQFIDDERFTMDTANLKNAVAKGAVLYMMAMRAMRSLQVLFDSDLNKRLPFDVVYHDPVTNTYPVLFHEHHRYEDIAANPQFLNLPEGSEPIATPVQTDLIQLGRRWPGDGDGCSPFLRFKFEDEVKFPVEVSFDLDTWQFAAKDSNGTSGTVIEESDTRIYESPVRRGDL